MDLLTIIGLIVILGISGILFLKERKHKLIYCGRNQNYYLVPLIIIIFIGVTFFSGRSIKPADIMVVIVIIPVAFVGNKCGITENGILLSSYLTTWDKISSYSITEEKNRYTLYYEGNGVRRRINFSKSVGEEVDNYLSKNRKIRHRKK